MSGLGPEQPLGGRPDSDESNRGRWALEFFQRLWLEGLPDGTSLVLVEHGFARHRFFQDLLAAATAILAGLFVCFGCAAMPVGLTSRGSATDAAAIPGAWFDLDLKGGKHKGSALPTLEQGMAFIYSLPIPPTLIVHSGGGLHIWWLFREAWIFESAAERDRAVRLIAGWQHFVLDAAIARGWRLDNTSALSSLLRPAGALNTKYDPPREVRLLECNETRWNPCDFEDWPSWDADGLGNPPGIPTDIALPKELPKAFSKAIAGLGVRAKERRRTGLLRAVVLETCPYCRGVQSTTRGIVHWTAHVAPISGALRCKRQSCDAREGPGGGIAFKDWVERLLPEDVAQEVLFLLHRRGKGWFDLESLPALAPDGTRTVSLEEADNGALFNHIAYCSDLSEERRCIVLCTVPTAAGKTRAVTELLGTRPSAYFAESHKLLDEVAEELVARGTPYVHLEGVGRVCLFKSAYRLYGQRFDWRGAACMSCPHQSDGSCPAWKPIPPGTVIIGPHESYPVVRNMRVLDPQTFRKHSLLKDRLVVLDEGYSSLEVLYFNRERVRVPLDHPEQFGDLAPDALQVSSALDGLMTRCLHYRRAEKSGEFPTFIAGDQLRGFWGEESAARNAELLFASIHATAASAKESWPRPKSYQLRDESVDPSNVAHPELRMLWRALLPLVEENPVGQAKLIAEHGLLECVASDDGVHFELRNLNTIPLRRGAGVLILDATGNLTLAELQAANPTTPIIHMPLDIRPDPRAKVESKTIFSTSVSRRTLLKDDVITKRGVGALRNSLRMAAAMAEDHIGPGKHRAALLTYMPIAEQLTGDAKLLASVSPQELDLPRDMIGYYGLDDRGSNRFKGVPVLVTLGDPLPNFGANAADARALGLDALELLRGRVAATLVQAQGRARALRAIGPVLLVHVGQVKVPGWGGDGAVKLPRGKPTDPARAAVIDVVVSALTGGQVISVPLVMAWMQGAGEADSTVAVNAYRESLVGIYRHRELPKRRTLNDWVRQAAKGHGAPSLTVKRGKRRMTAWRPPGMPEDAARAMALDAWRRLIPIKGEVIEPVVPAPAPDASDDAAWAEVIEVLGATGRACMACAGDQFWRLSPDHDWVCATCHPPTGPDLVEWRAE